MSAVNDVVVHPNQGELISCDQAGRIKQWDLSENICTHELVRYLSHVDLSTLVLIALQTPAGDIPMRSISLASDGSCLVAGNNKVAPSMDSPAFQCTHPVPVGSMLRMED